jgi:hypothetical protein
MDPALLAATAVSLVSGYLSRHGTDVADRIGDAAVERLGDVWRWMRDRLRGEKGADGALQRLDEKPTDQRSQGAVEFLLAQVIERDAALADQLAELVQAVDDERPGIVAQITESGAVSVHGDVKLTGTQVAGRDLVIGSDHGDAGQRRP